MAVNHIRKTEIARLQLERAIELYLEKQDYVCAITLGGAAEEILGKLAAQQGKQNSIESIRAVSCLLYRKLFGKTADPKRFADRANAARNALKHSDLLAPKDVDLDLKEEAGDILERAVHNYQLAEEHTTPLMEDFMRARFGLKPK